MTSEDIKYLSNSSVQNAILKIKFFCLKYALENDLDNEDFKNEYIMIIKDFNDEDRNYLINYFNNILRKMKSVLNGPEIKENTFNDGKWHWGDEVSPKR